jgi:hypothetical protein
MKVIALALISMGLAANAGATMASLKLFKAKYPAATEISKCAVCHEPDKKLNVYGIDLEKAGSDFAAVEALDSDGDGITNIDEINKNSFPGNKDSVPAAE